ncbi:MAG: hypothetical protein ACI9F9_001512 [Candidatus Paceibacteria bacterium]|jgi:hypothetical protein
MKNALTIALIAGVIGGVAGTVGTRMFSSTDAGTVTSLPTETALSPGGGDGTALVAQLDEMRRDNGELSIRLAALESSSIRSARTAVPVGGNADLSALQEQVAALAAALENPQSAPAVGLRNMVATALADVQEAESEQRQIEREQRSIDRIVEQMDGYSEKLGLDGLQRKEMQGVLVGANSKREEMFAAMRDGSTPRENVREAFTTMRDETNTSLQGILSSKQFEDYSEMSDDNGRGFGGRGGRGGGPGGR